MGIAATAGFGMARHGRNAASAALVLLALAATPAAAQSLGAYEGTIQVSGVQSGPAVTYKAKIKLVMPISSRDGSSISAEFLAGEAPNGTIELSQWDETDTQKSAGSDGQRGSYRCTLANPVTLPVSVTGVLDVDMAAGEHSFSVTVLSLSDAELNCVDSRSGPNKRELGVAITTGTGVPGAQSENKLPIASASHISSQYVLDPTAYTQGKFGPIKQQWDFQLTR